MSGSTSILCSSGYYILVSKQSSNKGVARPCDQGSVKVNYTEALKQDMNCYTAAGLTAAEVGEQMCLGLGNGETFGSFVNERLEGGELYHVTAVVEAELEVGDISIHSIHC